MYHYVNAITNTKGDALIGYYVKAVDPTTGSVVSIYADESSTPIVSVSGVANAAKVDSDGDVSFYVAGGTYHLDIYATDATTFVKRVQFIPMVDFTVAAGNVADRPTLAAKVAGNGDAYTLIEKGREGIFVFDSSNNATNVTNDPNQGIYVAPTSDTTGASGAWVRANRDVVNAFWFMSAAQVADVRAFTYTQNVTTALKAASAYIQYRGGGTLLLPPGGYLVVVQTANGLNPYDGITVESWAPTKIIHIENCTKAVKISGYGAVIKAANGYKYGSFVPGTATVYNPTLPFTDYTYYASPYRGIVAVAGNASVTIEGLELDGNNTLCALGGYWGDSQWQVEGHGISCSDNTSVTIQDCYVHHHPGDGLTFSKSTVVEGSALTPSIIRNCRFRYNGRQGCSFTGGKGVIFQNCDFSNTGQATNTVSSQLVQSAPGAGVDIEPSPTEVRDVSFINCTMLGNWTGRAISANTGDSRRISFHRCKLEGIQVVRPEYSFTDCTIIGNAQSGLALTDQYKLNVSGLSLTIAGSGPWTITRGSGSFITDGFAVGNTVQLSGGFNAANLQKNLTFTALTATVATVTVDGGSGNLVAEGPIASATMAIAMTMRDGLHYTRCNFTYDASLTESGSLVNATQSSMNTAAWHRFKDCSFNTGTVALPDFGLGYASGVIREHSPIFQNCRFKSTSSTGVTLVGRWQGYNYIDYGTTPIFNFGTQSRIESGDVVFNGVGQATGPKLTDGDYGDVVVSGSGTAMTVESLNPSDGQAIMFSTGAQDAYFDVQSQAGQYGTLRFVRGGLARWWVGMENTAEGGSNAGSDFQISRWSDAGGLLALNALKIARNTGNATFAGTVTASNLSGTNTGDQTITLTGDVTGSGTGSFAATIANSAVTVAKMANLAANSLLGNPTGSAAAPSAITLAGGLGNSGTTLTINGSISAATSVAIAGAITSSSASAGVGYATGAGGTVTQATSRTTGVTLNKAVGEITLVSAAGSASYQSFTVTNSSVAATDRIILNQKSGTDLYILLVTNIAAGSFKISFATTGGTTTEQPVIGFTVIKGVNA